MSTQTTALFQFDCWEAASHLIHLLVAYGLAVPVAWNREKESRSAGIRTFPLVALGACGFALLARAVFTSDEAQARVVYGIVTGIGFIGGGAILKERGHISGTATAAAVWCMGAVGVAVAYDRLEVALVVTTLIAVTFVVVGKTKELVHDGQQPDPHESGRNGPPSDG